MSKVLAFPISLIGGLGKGNDDDRICRETADRLSDHPRLCRRGVRRIRDGNAGRAEGLRVGLPQFLRPIRDRQRSSRYVLQVERFQAVEGPRGRADRGGRYLPGICRSAEEAARQISEFATIDRRLGRSAATRLRTT